MTIVPIADGRRTKYRTAAERFWTKVRKSKHDECWEWLGGKDSDGYGHFWEGKCQTQAHRFAFDLANGRIADGLCALHTCDNPSCVNPRHLYAGSNNDNVRDKVNRGRGSAGEGHGRRKLTFAQVERIRALRVAGERVRDIAAQFGLSRQHVYAIGHRKYWIPRGRATA